MKEKNYKTYKYIIFLILITSIGFIIGNIIINSNKTKTSIDFYEKNLPVIFSGIKSDELGYFMEIPILEKSGDYYQAQSLRFFTKIPAKQYQDPLVFEKNGKKVEFIPQQSAIKKTIAPIVYAKSNINYLIYRDAYELTDVVKRIQPDGIKEYLVLKSEQAPKKFEWILNIGDEIIIQKESDGAIRFYQDNIFLYRIPSPFMMDVNKQKSINCEWQLDKIPASPDASQGGNDNQYKLTLNYNSDNLSYPIALDPSVTDSYDDETKIAAKSNTQITGGQAKLSTGTWYNASWLYRKQITINSTVVSESDTGELNFPIMINLASDSDLAADALSTGNDILFTSSDGAIKIDHEIEKYDTDGDLIAWVETPSISSTSNTILYMYYGNAGAANQQNATGVWDTNFKGVWHFYDSSSPAQDSTGNNNDATLYGNLPNATEAKIYNGQDLNGTSGYARATNGLTGAVTLEAWVNADTLATSRTAIHVGLGWYGGDMVLLRKYNGDSRMHLIVNTEANCNITTAVLTAGIWYHIVGTVQTNNAKIYLNGALANSDTSLATSTNAGATTIGNNAGSNDWWEGMIDEVRISDVVRTAYWISNEYNNIASSSAFYGVGVEETNGYYVASGTITSTNLLSEQSPAQSIDSFYYNSSAIPVGTELEIQFSQDNSNWYSTSGSLNQWDTISATGGETLDLSGLGWSGSGFYYRVQFASNTAQTQTPVMDNIMMNYTAVPASGGQIKIKHGTIKIKHGTIKVK